MRDIFTLFLHAIVHRHSASSTWWAPFCCRGIRLDATPNLDSESWSETGSQSSSLGSHYCRLVHAVDASGTCLAVCGRLETVDSAAFPQNADEAEVPPTVLAQTSSTTRPQRTNQRTD